MSRRFVFFGIVVALLCIAVVIVGCTPVSSANDIAEEKANVAPADEQAEELEASTMMDEEVQVVSAFDAANGELPEGIAIDKPGNIYVSVGYPFWFPVEESFGEIWKISPDGEKTILHAFPGGPGAAGLAVSPSGELYFAYPNPMDPGSNGVYRLAGDSDPERLPGSENIVLANGLVFAQQGDLYVSDSALGTIWRIPRSGGEVESWIQHDWLMGCDPEVDPVGANGVAFWKDSLYVASTSRGLLVRVPLLKDGMAGEPEIVAGIDDCDPEFDELDGMDGITFDVHGNVFALLVMQHKLVRIDPNDGSFTLLLTDEDGLFNPASITFGTGKGNRQHVFLSNFALLPPEPDASLGPAILSYDVDVAGQPIP